MKGECENCETEADLTTVDMGKQTADVCPSCLPGYRKEGFRARNEPDGLHGPQWNDRRR